MDDDVNGIIIGEVSVERNYLFLCEDNLFASGAFKSDDDAIEHLKTHWPNKFAKGVEMRRY